MDSTIAGGAPQAGPSSGGTVEPASRVTATKGKSRTPSSQPLERYELRDPFAEATYRSDSLDKIIERAELLGSTRFIAIAADGTRTPVTQSGGGWHRGKQTAALPERSLDTTPDEPLAAAKAKSPPLRGRSVHGPVGNARLASKIDLDAERAAQIARLESDLRERYLIKRAPVTVGPVSLGHTEYRFRGDTSRIAFTETTFRLSTDTNSPSVARSMVDVAQARSWKGLRVTGSEDFRRLVWLEATVRGVKTVGYEANPADLDILRREREARQTNRIEQTHEGGAHADSSSNDKDSLRRGGGRKTVMAAIEAILIDKGVPESKREAALAAANAQLTQRARIGALPKVKVYDQAGPVRTRSATPAQDIDRSRARNTPAHAR